jgi:phospholipid/cholesterol/gamma-HCH transport system substrate-binding protein
MKINTLETRLGVFVVLTVLAAIFIIETLGGTELHRRGYRVSALFDTVQELKIDARVKMAGVDVGRVDKIDLAENKVRVVMKLDSDVVVKTDSKAVIKYAGLMGQNFVSLSFGSAGAPKVEEGAVLATTEQPDMNAIMEKLDKAATGIADLGKSFTGDKIDNLIGPLTDFIKQNSAPLTATIANIKSVSGQIAAGQGTIGRMIYSEALYSNAMATVSNLQDTVSGIHTAVNDINAGKGTIGKLMTDETLYKATTSSMTNLNSILLKINQGQGTMGKLVNNQDFYNNAKLSLQKLDKATDSLEDTGPLTVIGIFSHQFGL